MKAALLFLVLTPALVVPQEKPDTDSKKIVLSQDAMNSVNKIYNNPDALKYLLRTLLADKDKFREIFSEIVNDPAMKNVVKEIRNASRDDKGLLDKKKEPDVTKEDTDLTFLQKE